MKLEGEQPNEPVLPVGIARLREVRAGEGDSVTPALAGWRPLTGPDVAVIGGETTKEPLLYVKFQSGPIGEAGINGGQIDDVINVALRRTEAMQALGPCQENLHTIDHLKAALDWQRKRTATRVNQRVEGTRRLHREHPGG